MSEPIRIHNADLTQDFDRKHVQEILNAGQSVLLIPTELVNVAQEGRDWTEWARAHDLP